MKHPTDIFKWFGGGGCDPTPEDSWIIANNNSYYVLKTFYVLALCQALDIHYPIYTIHFTDGKSETQKS